MHFRTRAISAIIAGTLALGGLVAGADAASAAAKHDSFTIGTHNTKHGTSRYSAIADVIGWQELDNAAAQKRMVAALKGYRHYIPRGVAAEDSISWRASKFTLVSEHQVLTHKGQAHVTPNRYVTYVVLKDRRTGTSIAFVDTHFISAAFSGHPERQARWYTHERKLQQTVAALRAKHLPVFVVGDFNRQKTVALTGLRHYAVSGVSGTPIDQLYATTADKVGSAVRLSKNGSDHFAYRASAKI